MEQVFVHLFVQFLDRRGENALLGHHGYLVASHLSRVLRIIATVDGLHIAFKEVCHIGRVNVELLLKIGHQSHGCRTPHGVAQ